jgi:hypothetical protein
MLNIVAYFIPENLALHQQPIVLSEIRIARNQKNATDHSRELSFGRIARNWWSSPPI